ncbi:MAG: 2-polyprenyl-3-methyl-5-hydroxy-6-metoxy-1,4-benzoquinol methylase [Candidatus Azotimanducaceae bacterium]|jgi:2-polyprenyl-3-methyl-5-hydroxy-6-metoxy-1,4-benzoquinol methylase
MSVHDAGSEASRQQDKGYAGRLWQYKQAETVSLMIYVGRRLGLYPLLAGAGPITAAELAAKSGLHERWLLEWMRLQTAGKVLNFLPPDKFQLPDAGAMLLADESSPSFMLDNFDGGASAEVVEGLLESFRTGIGRTYESAGAEGALRGEARHWRAVRSQVIPNMIPALDGVQAKLEQGCLVIDVGCGDGALPLALAEAYPNSTFHAFDPNRHAVSHVTQVSKDMKLTNVTARVASGEDLPRDQKYDLIITFDCIHDMTHPQEVMSVIRDLIKDDGTWFIKDIRSKPDFEDNLRNPMLAMMYGFSLMSCMSSAMSEEGGAGLGTLGFNPEVAESMCRKAGFTRFQMHDFKDPGNLYYEVQV